MTVLEFSDAHHFLERTREFLFRAEVANNLLLSSALALSKSHSRSTQSPRALTFLAALDQKGRVAAVALRTPQFRWMVSAASQSLEGPEGSRRLAHTIANRPSSQHLRSFMLPDDTVDSFLNESFTGLRRATSSNFMSLTKLNSVTAAPGLIRLAQPKDLKKLMHWSQLSAKEGHLDESPSEAAEIIERYVAHRQLYVWENANRVVAMAAVGGFTPKVTRISQVYTDEPERGRGYASTLVHRLTHRTLTEATPTCVLFADASHPLTKKIYEKLGYKTVGTFSEFRRLEMIEAQRQLPRDHVGFNVTTTG